MVDDAHPLDIETSLTVTLSRLTHCVVVGGGDVATRKVQALLEAGVKPRIISPELHPDLKALIERSGLSYQKKAIEEADVQGAQLVVAATDDPQVNAWVGQVAARAGALYLLVHDAEASSVHMPATLRRGALQLAVSSGGKSPALARALKAELEPQLPAALAFVADFLGSLRAELKHLDRDERDRLIGRMLEPDALAHFARDPVDAEHHWREEVMRRQPLARC